MNIESFITLAIQDGKEGFFDAGSGLKFFWSLCPEKKSTTSGLCNDPSAAVCVFKVRHFDTV